MAAADLVARHRAEWEAAVHHPFLAAIGDGSLSPQAFARWLAQDYLFVGDLLRFQARLLAMAPRPAQALLAGGLVALASELTWFEQVATRIHLDLDVPHEESTAAYGRSLERLAGGLFDPALTALWALERVYLESWRGVAPGAPRYREFVAHWTVPEFAEYVSGLERLASDDPTAAAAFRQVLRLERAFWDMAWSAR